MKVLLFGASGNIGSAIAAELTSRGHSVTGATRSGPRPGDPQEIETLRVDATDAAEVAAAAPGYDAIVSALGPRHGADDDEAIIVGAARGLIDGARRAGVRRIIVVGGAGSLEIAAGVRLVDTPDFPAAWKSNALAAAAALDVFRGVTDLDWTYVSPAAVIEAGQRTGHYRAGGDQLVTDAGGSSRISYADFAIALADELELGNAVRRRMTAAY